MINQKKNINIFFNRFNSKSDLLISTLFLLIIPALVAGPFLPDLFVCLMGFIFLIKSLFHTELFSYYKKKFSFIFLFFFSTILISSLFSENILSSFESSLFYFRFYFFTICVFYILDNYEFLKKYFLIIALTTLCFLSLDSIYQYFTKYSMIFSIPIHDEVRASSLFFEELKLGNFVIRLTPLIIALLFFCFNKKSYEYLLILLFSFSILASGERTALGLLIIFFFATILIRFNMKDLIISSILIFFLLLGIFSTENNIKERMFYSTYDQIFL